MIINNTNNLTNSETYSYTGMITTIQQGPGHVQYNMKTFELLSIQGTVK